MASVAILLTDGFEDGEAVLCHDIFRRMQIQSEIVSCSCSLELRSYWGITMQTHRLFEEIKAGDYTALLLSGGPANTLELEKHQGLIELLKEHNDKGGLIFAQCSAPARILGHNGLLRGRHYTCSSDLQNSVDCGVFVDAPIVHEGSLVTGKGLGYSLDFALYTASLLTDTRSAEEQSEHIYHEPRFLELVKRFN